MHRLIILPLLAALALVPAMAAGAGGKSHKVNTTLKGNTVDSHGKTVTDAAVATDPNIKSGNGAAVGSTKFGIVGTTVGCILGLSVVLLQKQFGFFTLDSSVYIIPALPVELRWSDFLSVALGSFGLTAFCSLFPSRRAAKVEPAKALRWE